MFQERPGNVVVLSGRNQGKIDRIKASVEAGLNVLADKPWVIDPADFPKLEAALNTADQKQLIAYDIMTERFEITTILQRELVNDRDTFGAILPGSEKEPSVYMKSVHHLLKLVAGVPNRRPAWFFDVKQQGEAVPDVGTHLIDLAQWILFPNQALDYRKDVKVTAARRWPTVLTLAEFQKVTGEAEFPAFLRTAVRDGKLEYYCNGSVTYALRGVFVKLEPLWNYEAPAGAGDTHDAWVKGSRSRIEIRQGAAEKWKPELYVVPNAAADRPAVAAALAKKISSIQATYPGVAFRDQGAGFRVEIPDRYRVGHEPHFAQVTGNFLRYLDDPSKLPAWEKPDMLVKYYISTKALELSTH
jgi:predicted dehydrogenase